MNAMVVGAWPDGDDIRVADDRTSEGTLSAFVERDLEGLRFSGQLLGEHCC